jgi:hypothetical protein
VFDAAAQVRRLIEPRINLQLLSSGLAQLECTFLYCPVIMPPEMASSHVFLPRADQQRKALYVRPHLNYPVFEMGTRPAQIKEYLAGIVGEAARLSRLGASPAQIVEFIELVRTAGRTH